MRKFIPYITQFCCAKIWLEDVLFIEKTGRQTKIVTEEKEFLTYTNFDDIIENVDGSFFFCRKNMAINFDQVQAMQARTIYFINGRTYEMGRDNFIRTKQYFVRHLKKL